MKITLTQLRKLLAQPRFLLIAGLAVIIGAIVMLKTLTPLTPVDKSPLTQQNFDHSTSTFQLKFMGTEPTFPKHLPLGRLTLTTTSQTELLQPLIKQFQLQPVQGDPLVWTSTDYALVKDEGSGLFTLASQKPAERSAKLDESAAVKQAETLVKQLFPQTQLSLVAGSTRYLAGSQEQKVVSASQAELIELAFAPLLNNYPVLIKSSSQSLVQVELDSQSEVVKLTFLADIAQVNVVASEDKSWSLLSLDQAMTRINRGDGAIITADSSQVARLDLNTKLTGRLQNVGLEYRSTDDGRVVPYYRFSGQLQANGITLQADIITPAIDLTTLPSP